MEGEIILSRDQRTRLRIKVRCDCGAKILCKTRIVGQTRQCPACGKFFLVPHPDRPPNGELWNILPNASLKDYQLMEKTITEYGVAIDAKNTSPEIYDAIQGTLQVIRDFQDHFCS